MNEQQARDRLRAILDDAVGPLLPPEADAVAVAEGVYRVLMERGSISGVTIGHGQSSVAYTLILEDW